MPNSTKNWIRAFVFLLFLFVVITSEEEHNNNDISTSSKTNKLGDDLIAKIIHLIINIIGILNDTTIFRFNTTSVPITTVPNTTTATNISTAASSSTTSSTETSAIITTIKAEETTTMMPHFQVIFIERFKTSMEFKNVTECNEFIMGKFSKAMEESKQQESTCKKELEVAQQNHQYWMCVGIIFIVIFTLNCICYYIYFFLEFYVTGDTPCNIRLFTA